MKKTVCVTALLSHNYDVRSRVAIKECLLCSELFFTSSKFSAKAGAKVVLQKNTQGSPGTVKDRITFSNSLVCWHFFASDDKDGGVDGQILNLCKCCWKYWSRHAICMNYYSLTAERNWERRWIALWSRAGRSRELNNYDVSLFYNLAIGDGFFSGKSKLKSSTKEDCPRVRFLALFVRSFVANSSSFVRGSGCLVSNFGVVGLGACQSSK